MKETILRAMKQNKVLGPYIQAEEDQKELGIPTISGWVYFLCILGFSPAVLAYKKQYKQAIAVIVAYFAIVILLGREADNIGKTINLIAAFYTYFTVNNNFIKAQKEIFDQTDISSEDKIEKLKEACSVSKKSGYIFAGVMLAVLGVAGAIIG